MRLQQQQQQKPVTKKNYSKAKFKRNSGFKYKDGYLNLVKYVFDGMKKYKQYKPKAKNI